MIPLFTLGQVVAPPGALAALARAAQTPGDFLSRHVMGDWGDVWPEDAVENRVSTGMGWRILSSYTTKIGERLWVITEADRTSTCLLLPDEY